MLDRSWRGVRAKGPTATLTVAGVGRTRRWRDFAFSFKVRWRALLLGLHRRHLRSNEITLTLLGIAVGAVISIGVIIVRQILLLVHRAIFQLSPDHLLSEGVGLSWWRVLAVPCVGGLVVGVATLVIRRFRPREVVDAIEANALYGGKMSLIDSANLTVLTLLSGGFGASVGLEAAYT
ncbi:MAG TPA: chloride channel protein, partial [Stellaceae bacterium]|nr:chloride channel protein [Stellaceae bacterium]